MCTITVIIVYHYLLLLGLWYDQGMIYMCITTIKIFRLIILYIYKDFRLVISHFMIIYSWISILEMYHN